MQQRQARNQLELQDGGEARGRRRRQRGQRQQPQETTTTTTTTTEDGRRTVHRRYAFRRFFRSKAPSSDEKKCPGCHVVTKISVSS